MITNTINSGNIKDKEFLNNIVKNLATVQEKKSSIQEKALEISKKNSHLILSWGTGCGKSLAALKIIKNKVDSGDTTPWFIVCSEINHIDNWISEIVKHKLGYLMPHIEIFCYASLGKYKNKRANLILDESHSVSDLRLDHLKTIQVDNIISLSATLNQVRKNQLLLLRPFREFEITITDAINIGILPAPKIFVIHDKLNNDPRYSDLRYVKTKGGWIKTGKGLITAPIIKCEYKDYFEVLKKNKEVPQYQLHVSCTQDQYYNLISADLEYYKNIVMASGSITHKNKMLRLGSDRKAFISSIKDDILEELDYMLDINGYRFISFTGTIEQCDRIGGNLAIHSKIPQKEIKARIDRFNKKESNSIYAVQMLREGQNFEDIEAGIITQLDSEDLSFVQMMGRIFRSTNPILFVIIKDNTQDVTYLKKCIDSLDNKYITYLEYTEDNMLTLNKMLCSEKARKNSESLKELN